jgi:DnaJ-class molecular chaperone
MSKPSLYEILGIEKTATDDDIKRAFKKAALKYHPDRNPNNKEEASAKFLEARKAHDILINPQKRQQYDRFGDLDNDNNQAGPPPGASPFDMFGNIFGGFPGFGGMGGGFGGMGGGNGDEQRGAKSPEKKLTVNLKLSDVYNGKQVPIDFKKFICCDDCKGKGTPSNDGIKTCNQCNGQGRVVRVIQMGPMVQQTVSNCTPCGGKGKTIIPGSECKKCSGKKMISISRHLDCYVRPGSNPGTSITFKNESDWHPDFDEMGDLIVYVNSGNEEGAFRREGDNLIMTKHITLLEALTGTEFRFKHLDNRVLSVKYEDIIKPNQSMVIKNEGMPNLTDQLQHGDLIVKFEVTFPTHLEKERSKYLVKILPSPKKQIWDTQLDLIPETEVTIANLEAYQDNTKYNTSNNSQHNSQQQSQNTQHQPDIDMDDDDHPFTKFAKGTMPGSNPVECATQ